MNRQNTLSLVAGAVAFGAAVYFVPLGIMAVCIELGWHA